jgi:hypothetical protein
MSDGWLSYVNAHIFGIVVFITQLYTIHLIKKQGRTAVASNQDILDEITAQSTIEDSVLALVKQLVADNDPASRQAILDGLIANKAKLNAAILAGTPQAPTT